MIGKSRKKDFKKNVGEQNALPSFNIKNEDLIINDLGVNKSGKIKNNLAKSTLEKMLDTGSGVGEFVSESDMAGLDEGAMKELCEKAVASNPKAVEDYKKGKQKAVKSLVGFVMKESRGKADAAAAEAYIIEIIKLK